MILSSSTLMLDSGCAVELKLVIFFTNPLIKDSFFLPQSDVDTYVGSTGQDTAHVVQVNHSALKFLLCHGMVLVHILML